MSKETQEEQHHGVVVSMRYERNFGFISPDGDIIEDEEELNEVFFHASACDDNFKAISPGDRVVFIQRRTRKGIRAFHVRRAQVKE